MVFRDVANCGICGEQIATAGRKHPIVETSKADAEVLRLTSGLAKERQPYAALPLPPCTVALHALP
jgi:hypothetical protein